MKARRVDTYAARRDRLAQQLQGATGQVTLRKKNSNLFRDRDRASKPRLDVHDFNHVLQVDPRSGWADAEGMTAYETLVLSTLACGTMPAVVPQLKTITLGGAVAGVGIEASSFRQGLVHQGVLEMDILAGDGKVYLCSPQNEHSDLFFGFPNSYGTLGYALRVRIKTMPVRKFVRIEHSRFDDASAYFRGLHALCESAADFVDGVVFGPDELYLTAATFVDEAPLVSDYTFEHIYYRSIRERDTDYLSVHDFLWRWDTDWFWCSKNFGAQNPLIRRLAGKARLNSRTYTSIMRWNSRWRLTQRFGALFGVQRESVIQDVDIPIERAAEFLEFFRREVGILPIWICPIRSPDARAFPLYPLNPATTYVNFGFWDVVKSNKSQLPGHFNRLIERKVAQLGGIKSLYSDSYFSRQEFDAIYGAQAYRELKSRYDPHNRLHDLYDKCVLRR
ncbi:MAG TPA: FAD-binding oxidoreductase [Burkholderiales bacterium]|nr:FAD-binding oxidoreductase [Burkholderiales bacterium]